MTATTGNMMPFTITQFVLMGVFALLAVAVILWGMKLKRDRRVAGEELEAHRDAADAPTAAVAGAKDASAPEAPADTMPPAPVPDPVDTGPGATLAEAVAATPLPGAAPAGDIMQLKGLGPKLAATLAGLGVTRVDQIAAMSPAELDALDARLGAFRGRPARDRWAEQARLLAGGDTAAYEAEFGKLGG